MRFLIMSASFPLSPRSGLPSRVAPQETTRAGAAAWSARFGFFLHHLSFKWAAQPGLTGFCRCERGCGYTPSPGTCDGPALDGVVTSTDLTADRRRIHRRRGRLPSLGAALLLASCGDHDDARTFPIRLLPEVVDDGPQALVDERFDEAAHLADWFLVESVGDEPRITGAHEHPAVTIADGSVTVNAHPAALVRFFEAPYGYAMSGTVTLSGVDGGPVPDGTDLHLPGIQTIDDGDTAEALLGADLDAITTQLLLALHEHRGYTAARWQSDPRGSGHAIGSVWVPDSRGRHLRAVGVTTDSGPVVIDSIQVDPAPTSHPTIDLVPTEDGAGIEPVVAHVAMERVPSMSLATGESAALTADVPRGARSISYRVSRHPVDAATTSWNLTITQGDASRVIDAGLFSESDQAATFRERTIAWPVEGFSPGELVLTWRNTGAGRILIGQPMIRGPKEPRRRNLLFLSIDTLRADHLGYHGYARPTSPFLDRFAASANAFLEMRSVAPYTLPTHVTMFTGMLPPRHGTYGLGARMNASKVVYLPLLLARNGYHTAAFTGGGYVSPNFGFAAGFDRYSTSDPLMPIDGVGLTPPKPWHGRSLDEVVDWILDRRDEQWFAMVHTYAVHNYYVDPETFARFDSEPDSAWRDDLDANFPNTEFAPWRRNPPSPGDVQHLIDLYDATIRYVDEELERFFTTLDAVGALDDTIVVITSDHGEEFLEHGNLRHSISLYDELLRIPLMIRMPGQREGRSFREPMTLADLTPTLMELLGFPALPHLDGASVASLIEGDGPPRESSPSFAHIDTTLSKRWSLRHGDLKIIWGDQAPALGAPAPEEWELYDLQHDPGEQVNVATTRAADFTRLRGRLEVLITEQLEQAIDGESAVVSEELNETLKQLGYVR